MSVVVMSLGTGSDVRSIEGIVSETLRVLKPGGRFLFSFYNKEALLYRWEFLPWPVDLAASINFHRNCLEVHIEGKGDANKLGDEQIYSVYAHPYTTHEVRSLFQRFGVEVETLTFPTIGTILPHELFEGQPNMQEAVTAIDQSLANSTVGAYIIATGQKK